MDWDAFFARTKDAAGVESYSKLAPLLGITDGAIGQYRQGRRVPQVWVVAEALKIQQHPTPEKAAIEIMKAAALTSSERKFWRRLLATTALLVVFVLPTLQNQALSHFEDENKGIPEPCALCEIRRWLSQVAAKLVRFAWGSKNACLLPL